jgi:hypothetical protein
MSLCECHSTVLLTYETDILLLVCWTCYYYYYYYCNNNDDKDAYLVLSPILGPVGFPISWVPRVISAGTEQPGLIFNPHPMLG